MLLDQTLTNRRGAMGLLARAKPADVAALFTIHEPAFIWARAPETGLVMVQGRMGGEGGPFNLGEMTVTRCVVQLASDGRVIEQGLTDQVLDDPQHGYTQLLVSSVLQI